MSKEQSVTNKVSATSHKQTASPALSAEPGLLAPTPASLMALSNRPLRPIDVLQLQRVQGNSYVQSLFGRKSASLQRQAVDHAAAPAATATPTILSEEQLKEANKHNQQPVRGPHVIYAWHYLATSSDNYFEDWQTWSGHITSKAEGPHFRPTDFTPFSKAVAKWQAKHAQSVDGKITKKLIEEIRTTELTAVGGWEGKDKQDWQQVRTDEAQARDDVQKGRSTVQQAIVGLAASQIGTVFELNREDDPNGQKYGWERIARYYEVVLGAKEAFANQAQKWTAANPGKPATDNPYTGQGPEDFFDREPDAAGNKTGKAQNNVKGLEGIQKGNRFFGHPEAKLRKGAWSWCGIFALWSVRAVTGKGWWDPTSSQKVQGLTRVEGSGLFDGSGASKRLTAEPGDILFFATTNNHIGILAEPHDPAQTGPLITTVEGNVALQSITLNRTFPIDKVVAYYKATSGSSGSPQATSGVSQPATAPATASPSGSGGASPIQLKRDTAKATVQFQRPLQIARQAADPSSSQATAVPSTTDSILQTAKAGDYVQAYKLLNGRWLKSILEILDEAKQKGQLTSLVDNFGQAEGIHRPRLWLALKAAQLQGTTTPDNFKQQFATEFATLDKNPDQQLLLVNFLAIPSAQPTAQPATQPGAALNSNAPFSASDAQQIQQAWSASGSYTISDSGDQLETQSYMRWRANAQAAIAKLKGDKAQDARDWLSQYEAHERWNLHKKGTEPTNPGATPADLATANYQKNKAVGSAPSPAFREVQKYDVTLPNNQGNYSFRDDPIKKSYRYMKNEAGVAKVGQKVSDRTDADKLFQAAGITDAVVIKVMKKVSTKEGGFEAVNTYDTGYVSVGFIQFISGEKGTTADSLVKLLQTLKQSDAAAFKSYFHDMGIDVDKKGLTVVDPASGTILQGAAAVQAVMNDKRLTAVFHNAGQQSEAFRVAQIKTAYNLYYIPDQSFTVKEGTTTISGKYKDVLQSEAGKTAAMDRGVQKGVPGTKKVFAAKCQALIKAHKLTSVADLAKYEAAIIPEIKNRIDVLSDGDLSQPAAVP